MPTNTGPNCRLLPVSKAYRELLIPYLLPYLIYVAVATLADGIIPVRWEEPLKFVCTSAAMVWFFKIYRFGPFSIKHGAIAAAWLPMALGLWIGPLYLFNCYHLFEVPVAATIEGDAFSMAFGLQLINAVLLVALFEELFMRVYLMSWFHQAGALRKGKGIASAIMDAFDQHPQKLDSPPISTFAVVLTTFFFTGGHRVYEYPSAAAYFLFTTWLYHRTHSLWVCIIIHGLTNLAIALLVRRYAGMAFLS